MSNSSKENLRVKLLKIRRNIKNKDLKDELIYQQIKNLKTFQSSDSILIYVNNSEEVSTRKLIEKCWELGKNVYAPFVNEVDIGLVSSWKDFDKEKLNGEVYLVPKNISLDFSINTGIIPGVGFDKKGNRIGFGSGWYDQFLSQFSIKTLIGIAYDEQVVSSITPQEHDVKISILLTPSKCYYF